MRRLAALASLQISLYAKTRKMETVFQQYGHLLDRDVTQQVVDEFPLTPRDLFPDNPNMGSRYQLLYLHCQGDLVALTAIGLYLLAMMEEEVLSMVETVFAVRQPLTIEVVGRMCRPQMDVMEQMDLLRSAYDLVHILLLAETTPNFLKSPFRLDGRLASFLLGDDRLDWNVSQVATLFEEDLSQETAVLTAGQMERTKAILEQAPPRPVVLVRGEAGSGRRFFVKKLASSVGAQVIFLPFSAVLDGRQLYEFFWQKVQRELLLSDRVLCLTDLAKDCPVPILRRMEADLNKFQRPFFLLSQADARLLPALEGNVVHIQIPAPSINQGRQFWTIFSAQYLRQEHALPTQTLASKMNLTPGQIQRVVELLALEDPVGPWDVRDIFKLCYSVLDDGSYQSVNFVNTTYTIDDLKLEPNLKGTLHEICAQVDNQELVLDTWGLRRKFPYGRSVSVLFSGPPGTGKTMSAQVLASMLGLELYQIDLSQVVDKYIGETEKRLSLVFDQAEKTNMILFFDEADALLGKRSEVKDSKDKHANTEVAYLLQRIEQFSGIVIMATNQPGNMDRAFLRRFRYHLVFSLPDQALRQEIWQSTLSSIPNAHLDWEYLASQFELSGAQIKNIVLNATYRAANDDGLLTMTHIVKAVESEQRKEGHFMVDFGQYGGLLH